MSRGAEMRDWEAPAREPERKGMRRVSEVVVGGRRREERREEEVV